MAEHTRTPWHVNHDRPDDDTSQLSISNGDARIIANVVTHRSTHGFDGGSTNAAFIVNAVNNHKALVEALKLAEDVLSRAPFSTGFWPNGMHPQTGIDQIRDAITNAVGGSRG